MYILQLVIIYRPRIKRSEEYTGRTYCDGYFRCYDSFLNGRGYTYHSMCIARRKLKVCVKMVLQAQPQVEKVCSAVARKVMEYTADYWCNQQDGFFKWRQYYKCPYTFTPIPVYKDFSPKMLTLGYLGRFYRHGYLGGGSF